MASREFYKRALQPNQDLVSSPFTSTGEMSPITSLAFNLHTTTFMHTPVKRLSLNSTASSTSSFQLPSTNKSISSDSNYSSSSPDKSPSSPKTHSLPSSCNKENIPTSFHFSPSHTRSLVRHRSSPLKEVQNTVNRKIFSSPLKSPLRKQVTPKKVFESGLRCSPIEDFDTNSQDSGYSESNRKESVEKRDISDSAIALSAPRRLDLDLSPLKPIKHSPSYKYNDRHRSFASLSCEEDAMCLELLGDDCEDKSDTSMPDFSNLLTAPIQQNMGSSVIRNSTPSSSGFNDNETPSRFSIRRCLSMMDTTPTSSKTSTFLVKPSITNYTTPPPQGNSFKRPHPPSESNDAKRRKQVTSPTDDAGLEMKKPSAAPLCQRQLSAPSTSPTIIKPKIMRCHSESQVSIMKAVNKSTNREGELTGDFSRCISLPIVEGGKHSDLKAISVHTMASLIKGEYSENVKYKIIDCRYPYEYNGGHIPNAVNWHHPQMVLDYLEQMTGEAKIPDVDAPREILIFHCEFSAERGPTAQRLLRNHDRIINDINYPALYFPEIYLLEGGYKVFYENYPELCTPNSYVRMHDSEHSNDFKHFRQKSKSWAADNKMSKASRGCISRTGSSKRLGLKF